MLIQGAWRWVSLRSTHPTVITMRQNFFRAASFAARMAHRTAALLVTMENNAGFAPQRAAIAFGCIPCMAHGVSTSRQMKNPAAVFGRRAEISVCHFAG